MRKTIDGTCGGSFINTNLSGDDVNDRKFCILCHNRVNEFKPSEADESIFNRLHIVGGGYRENVLCSKCYSLDRERWTFYVLKTYTEVFRKQCNVLHFAPEDNLSEHICANPKCNYYSGDVIRGKAMNVINVLDIRFQDETFDYIIINHVLEHIEDEQKAISELMRVLKKDGKLIIFFQFVQSKRHMRIRRSRQRENA